MPFKANFRNAVYWLAIPVLILLAFVANLKALNCYFLADDFLCLEYIYKGFHGEPEILFQRLISPWQDRGVSLFYRPICDLLLYADYALWSRNAFGYHLSNLLLHAAATTFLYLMLLRLGHGLKGAAPFVFASLSAALFATYPLHVEPVVWLVGRADLFAALCIFACIFFCIPAIEKKQKSFGLLPICFYALALLSKEAAACVPAIVLFYCLLASNYRPRLRTMLDMFIPFVITTVVYLLLRGVLLGSIIGGYTGSLGDLLSRQNLDNPAIFDSLSLFSLGINLFVFTPESIEVLLLHAIYLLLALVLFLRTFALPWSRPELRIIGFFLMSTAMCCMPALQVIGLTGALSNSRVFYLPSAFFLPLLVAVVIPLAQHSGRKISLIKGLSCLSTAAFLFLAGLYAVISAKDYQPWVEASEMLLNMQAQAQEILQTLKPEQRLVLLNLNSNHRGAHVFYESAELKTLLGRNFFDNDLSERLLGLDEFPDFGTPSIGRLRRMLMDPQNYQIYMYDLPSNKFLPLVASASQSLLKVNVAGTVQAAPKPNELDCASWVKFEQPVSIDDQSQLLITLNWKGQGYKRAATMCLGIDETDVADQYMTITAIPFTRIPKFDYHYSTLELRRFASKTPSNLLYVRVPNGAEVEKATILPGKLCAQLQPDLATVKEMITGNYQPTGAKVDLELDVHEVPEAVSMVLEQAEPNYLFRFGKFCLRDPQTYRYLARKISIAGTSARYSVPVAELKPGYRHVFRLCALNAKGEYLGFYSDTVCIDLRFFEAGEPRALRQ